jgi:hypothetical protein
MYILVYDIYFQEFFMTYIKNNFKHLIHQHNYKNSVYLSFLNVFLAVTIEWEIISKQFNNANNEDIPI